MRHLVWIAALFGTCLAPAPAAAQATGEPRTAIGIGAAIAGIRAAGDTGPDASVTLRVDRRWTDALAWGVEAGLHGLRDEEPRVGDLTVDASGLGITVHRRPRIVSVRTILGTVTLTRPSGVFVRPAGGLGGHAYATYGPFPALSRPEVGREWGLVFGIAAGRTWRLSRHAALAIEGFFLASSGEDSTTGRQVFGVQVVPLLRF